jgi:hypothetical protein
LLKDCFIFIERYPAVFVGFFLIWGSSLSRQVI